jgi:hypothetical protein
MHSKNKKVLDRKISFVIQGPIHKEKDVTKNCCKSIRKFFPESKIILSTWKGSNLDDLDIDEKIESDDPGSDVFYSNNHKIENNINRMLCSSLNGLLAANSEYSVKLRSDMYFQSSSLSNLLGTISESKSKFTKKKILIPSNMAINPDREIKLLFSPSDFFFAGLTEDLVDLYSIPLVSDEELKYFNSYKEGYENILRIRSRAKYSSEQHLFCSFIKKKMKINFKNAFDYNKNNKSVHNEVFSNLFMMKNNKRIGMNSYKYPMSFFSSTLYYAYTEKEFKNLSGEYALFDEERLISNFIRYTKKISLLFFSKETYFKIKTFLLKKFI